MGGSEIGFCMVCMREDARGLCGRCQEGCCSCCRAGRGGQLCCETVKTGGCGGFVRCVRSRCAGSLSMGEGSAYGCIMYSPISTLVFAITCGW